MYEGGKISIAKSGVPQGGPISPTIFNIVMNGVDEEIIKADKRVFPIRYADDITVFANDLASLEKMKEVITHFLKPRGLRLNEEKTKVVDISEGINMLGYYIREYPDLTRVGKPGKPHKKGIVLMKPSKQAKLRFKANISEAIRHCNKGSAYNLILKLNPIIRG